jgi:hypothetical protein
VHETRGRRPFRRGTHQGGGGVDVDRTSKHAIGVTPWRDDRGQVNYHRRRHIVDEGFDLIGLAQIHGTHIHTDRQ